MLRQLTRYFLPLWFLAGLMVAQLEAAGVRDEARLFSASTVRKVDAELDHLEKRAHVDVVIETIDSIPGLGSNPSPEAKHTAIENLAERRAREIGYEGVYLLISKNDHVFSKVLVRERYDALLPRHERLAIRDALQSAFKAGKFDQGLLSATETIERSFSGVPIQPRAVRDVPDGQHAGAQHPRFGLGTLLMIGLGIFGVLLLLRLLGGLFGHGSAAGYPPQTGMGGMPRPGMGPGYGGPGGYSYGAPRGGGFFSGMLGGLGGALAGNWLYDQFSGRHGGHTDYASNVPPDAPVSQSPESDAFVGGDDDGQGGTSWDDSGGTESGSGSTGDWGGGDGGGDWGGGGGDGGDWGGGDGGGDW